MSDRPVVPWSVIDDYLDCTCREQGTNCQHSTALGEAVSSAARAARIRWQQSKDQS